MSASSLQPGLPDMAARRAPRTIALRLIGEFVCEVGWLAEPYRIELAKRIAAAIEADRAAGRADDEREMLRLARCCAGGISAKASKGPGTAARRPRKADRRRAAAEPPAPKPETSRAGRAKRRQAESGKNPPA